MEREKLQKIARLKSTPSGKAFKAQALLLIDEGEFGEGLTDTECLKQCNLKPRSLERLRKKAALEGPLESLERKPRKPSSKLNKFGGYEQAQLVQLACSDAPEGRARWTLSLLAERLVEMNVVESVCRETIRKELKKTNCSLGENNAGVSHQKKTLPS